MTHIDPIATGSDRQRDIYLNGLAGKRSAIPVDFSELKQQAKNQMTREAYAYVAGGAGRELTIAANKEAFEQWRIRPRMLRNVEHRDLSIELFGRKLDAPLLLAPIGVLDLATPDGDLKLARAAARLRVPMIFSNQASASMEDCSAQMGDSPRWFQLYWSKSNALVESLVSRAEKCGCEAIVVTLDTTQLGWRTRDLELAYLPFLYGRGIAQYVSDPVFQSLLDQPDDEPPPPRQVTLSSIRALIGMAQRYPGSFWTNLRSGRPIRAVRTFTRIYSRPSLTWQDLAFLRERTQLPILLKGILHPDDARLALDHGVDGLIVSNHGGRQVDGSIGAAQALPEVVEAVQDRVPVLFDSGIRNGADMFKAVALGARAVCLGRPYVYGLALSGQEGAETVIKNLLADFDLTMALAGCASTKEINSQALVAADLGR